MDGVASVRIDRLLWFLRFAKTRTRAQKWITEGHIRCNGERILRTNQPIRIGDVLTLPLAQHVSVIEILSLPGRRGPREEALSHYRALDAGVPIAIAGAQQTTHKGLPFP